MGWFMNVALCKFFSPPSFLISAYCRLKEKIAAVTKYAFSQQTNIDCHLQMWRNFTRLQTFRSRNPSGAVELREEDFFSRSEWLGKSFAEFTHFLKAKNQPKMKHYLREALKEAPIYPHFYDSEGHDYFTTVERKTFAPYFLKEVSEKELSYTLPVKTSGKKVFFRVRDPEMGIEGKFMPREIGTYKLLLLNLGLDSAHSPIEEGHIDYEVAVELQNHMRRTNTSWNPVICKKEDLIEYALAKLFKEKPELFDKVKGVVDFYFKIWSQYETVYSQFDQNQRSFKEKRIERYLPGKEQMLAFCLMKNVQYLWFAAISSTAFCRFLGIPNFFQYIPLVVGPKQYCKAAYKEQFLDVWKEIALEVQKEYPGKLDWVSFSGHGSVISFDQRLIEAQNKRNIHNRGLAQDLAIAAIDSLWAKHMDIFYKRSF